MSNSVRTLRFFCFPKSDSVTIYCTCMQLDKLIFLWKSMIAKGNELFMKKTTFRYIGYGHYVNLYSTLSSSKVLCTKSCILCINFIFVRNDRKSSCGVWNNSRPAFQNYCCWMLVNIWPSRPFEFVAANHELCGDLLTLYIFYNPYVRLVCVCHCNPFSNFNTVN